MRVPDEVHTLLRNFDTSPKPVLVRCKAGADRTGFWLRLGMGSSPHYAETSRVLLSIATVLFRADDEEVIRGSSGTWLSVLHRFEASVFMVAKKKSPLTVPALSRENNRLKLRLRAGANRFDALVIEFRSESNRRREMESALKKSEKHHTFLLLQSREMQEHLRTLTRKILTAQEDERREISRELHDEIAQTLTGINVQLANLKRDAVVNTKGLKGKIAGTQRLVQKSVKIVHRFARRLRPTLLDDLGLIPALSSFISGLKDRTKMPIKMVTISELQDLDVQKRTVFYRVAQEALTNIVRHAEAKAAEVIFKQRPAGVLMEIKDNGKSFNVHFVLLAKGKKHLGVLGMRERVEMVGGVFKIKSSPGEGTLVSAEIPVPRHREARRAK